MNEEELAEAIQEATKPRWRWPWMRPVVQAKAAGFLLASVAGGLALARLGVDGYLASHLLLMAGPVLAVLVVGFISHAWRQNVITVSGDDMAHPAEPAHLADQASEVAQPVARPTSQPQVTVTVRSLPAAQPTIPIPGVTPTKTPQPIYAPWSDPDGDD